MQPRCEENENVSPRTRIATLLRQIDLRSPAGFAIALHIRFTTPTFLFQTYAKRWTEHYSARGLMPRDPTVRWGFHNLGYVRWADLEAMDDGGVLEAAKDHGLMNGVAIAVYEQGSRSIASFARADRDYDLAEMIALEDLLRALHLATVASEALDESDRAALMDLSIALTR